MWQICSVLDLVIREEVGAEAEHSHCSHLHPVVDMPKDWMTGVFSLVERFVLQLKSEDLMPQLEGRGRSERYMSFIGRYVFIVYTPLQRPSPGLRGQYLCTKIYPFIFYRTSWLSRVTNQGAK